MASVRSWLRGFVVLSAALQALVIGAFGYLALTGDEWGIARGMTILLLPAFLALTGPSLWLLKRNQLWAAAALAAAGPLIMTVLWWRA
jgi:hypothetical protein